MTNETDAHHMQLALEAAKAAAERGEVPVGAVVVDSNNTIVSTAANTRECETDPTGHAELKAIQLASQKLKRWRLSDCTLYVTLEPCFMCAGAIVNARLGRVVYGAVDPKAGACESLANVIQDARLNHRCEVTSGVLAEESSILLKDFFKQRRK